MWRTEATSWDNGRPDGVALIFHVIAYKVEPAVAHRCFNLLTHDMLRAALADEVEPRRPEVPLVSKPCSFACRAERLAGTGTRPYTAGVGPPGASEGVGPDTNTRKEVTLGVAGEVTGCDVKDGSVIDVSISYVTGGDQRTKPCNCLRIVLVVVIQER